MRLCTTVLAVLAVSTAIAGAQDKAALVAEGKSIIMAFGGALKGELQTAMTTGGPVMAIGVCNLRAPEIAEQVSLESGWTVARSSHRLRNPGNEPDDYTSAIIADFLAREQSGEAASDLTSAEIVKEDDANVFRMVKAIPMAEGCVACHGGASVTPEVEAAIAELYPEDQARGFEVGEMRGVFVLNKTLQD